MGSIHLQVWVCLKTPQNSQFPEVRPFFIGRISLRILSYILVRTTSHARVSDVADKQTNRRHKDIHLWSNTLHWLHGCMRLSSGRAWSVFSSAVFASFKLHEGSTQRVNINEQTQKRTSIQIHGWQPIPKWYGAWFWTTPGRKKHQNSSSFFACHPSLDLNICPKSRHGCRPFFVKPPHKESKLWSDASVSVSQANKIFFVVLNLSQGRESWVDLVDTSFTQCKYDSPKMTRNTWKNHCSTMSPYMFNDLVWTKYVVHLQLEWRMCRIFTVHITPCHCELSQW